MPTIRIPLAVNLESRDGEIDPRDDSAVIGRDARIVNGIVESKPNGGLVVRKRPGLASLGTIRNSGGQLLWNWNGIRAVIDDYICSGSVTAINGTSAVTNLTQSSTGLQCSAANTGSGAATPRMMFKNRSQAWTMNRAGTVSAVSYGGTMGSETFAVQSITRASTTATATVAGEVPYNIGDTVTIAGANEGSYNGSQTVTAITPAEYSPAIDIPITITRSGTTATAVTVSGPHNLSTGTYTISGANDAAYNGSKSITVTNSTTFTYTVSVTGAGTTTWNPSDKNASITLSSGDLTATNGSSSATDSKAVRGTIGNATGKWYWEVTIGTVGGNIQLGVAKAAESLSDFVGSGAGGYGYNNFGTLWNSGSGLVTVSPFVAGNVIGVALDMDSGEVSFYRNGVLQYKFTALSGTFYPAVSMVNGGAVTANFGGSAFAHAIPSGFAALNSDSPPSPAGGTIIVTKPAVSNPATFTYTVGGSPSTPATGTITVQGTGGTVPGIAYLNGYFAVMDTAGTIWNSGIDDPTSWNALDFVAAQTDSSRGAGIAVSRGYLVAFKEWTAEYFYDASNATGSPFSPVDSGTVQVGCANGFSIAAIDDLTFWLSQTRTKGRGVHVLTGLEQRKVSTPDVDRILEEFDVSVVYAYCLKTQGHSLYVLTIGTPGVDAVTLVYDYTAEVWYEWTTYTSVGTSISSISITRTGNEATATGTTSGTLRDGMWVMITGANQAEYNGVHQVKRVSGSSFTFTVRGNPTSPATGTIAGSFGTPSSLPFVGAISFAGSVLLLNVTGQLCALDPDVTTDSVALTGSGIDFIVRTPIFDAGTLDRKSMPAMAILANRLDDSLMVRWSDDDFRTASSFREIDLSLERPELRRCGSFVRRSLEIKHTGNTAPILEAVQISLAG